METIKKERSRQQCPQLWQDCKYPNVEVKCLCGENRTNSLSLVRCVIIKTALIKNNQAIYENRRRAHLSIQFRCGCYRVKIGNFSQLENG